MDLFQTSEYKSLIMAHIKNTITYLFSKNQEFGIVCEVKHVHFDPELPESIKESFDNTILFILSGYTFESAKLEKDTFFFEAGFGSDNFGSTVNIPLLAIKQIMVDEYPIVFNLADPKKEDKAKENSMEALLNNPKNRALLKKKES